MALIEQEALVEAVEASLHDNPHTDKKVHANHIYEHQHMLRLIDCMPTIEAAPVVHCKDCQYFRPDDPNGELCANISGLTEPDEDDYCSRWSARMDGGEGHEAY